MLVDVDLAPLAASMLHVEAAALRYGARVFGAHIATEAAVKAISQARDELRAAFA